MTIPAGLREFCQARGISDAHPSTWGAEDHRAFAAWKLAAFKARWRAAVDNGDVDRTRRQQGRAYVIRRVQDDVADAMAPAPSDTYRFCDCHPQRPWPSPAKDDTEPRTPGDIVAWLTATFARRTA